MNKMQAPAHVKSIDVKKGLVTVLVSAYGNVDSDRDVVLPHAFDRMIAKWKARARANPPQFMPVVYGHQDAPAAILGKYVDMRSTTEGLEMDAQYFMGKDEARMVVEAMDAGIDLGQSFGYEIIQAKSNSHGGLDLAELDVFEAGPTLYPSNTATRTVSVKGEKESTAIVLAKADQQLDESAWDANKAMGACETASDFESICAGVHGAGEPGQRQHYALPHHYLGKPANAAGVAAARQRFDATQDLANSAAAHTHLFETHQLPSDAAKADPEGSPATITEPETKVAEPEAKAGREFSSKNVAALLQVHDAVHAMLGMAGHEEASGGKGDQPLEKTAETEGKADEPAGAKAEDHPFTAEYRKRFMDEREEVNSSA